ncbi:hypothetical protein V2W45_1254364, partial [Cenococcum geophilum]
GAKPAVLITKDRAIRLKATTIGVATIAIFIIKKVLIALRRKSNSEEKYLLKELGNNV